MLWIVRIILFSDFIKTCEVWYRIYFVICFMVTLMLHIIRQRVFLVHFKIISLHFISFMKFLCNVICVLIILLPSSMFSYINSLFSTHTKLFQSLEIPSSTICSIHFWMVALNRSIDYIPGTTPFKRSEDGLHKTNAMAFWKFCMFACYVIFACFCLIMLFAPHFFCYIFGFIV